MYLTYLAYLVIFLLILPALPLTIPIYILFEIIKGPDTDAGFFGFLLLFSIFLGGAVIWPALISLFL